jgi:hypothetical protein
MKKIVSLITMAAMLAVSTPAIANGRHNDNRWGVDSNRNSPYHNKHHRNKNRINTGEAVALILGGAILGAVISKNNRREREVVYQDYRTQVCQDIIKYDYYGNPYVTGRNCWYQ